MERRLILATVLSTVIIILWAMWTYKTTGKQPFTPPQTQTVKKEESRAQSSPSVQQPQSVQSVKKDKSEPVCGMDITLETDSYKAIFNSAGAKIKNFYVKEKRGGLVDMVLQSIDSSYIPENFTTFPEANFKVQATSQNSIKFNTVVNKIKILKTYELQDNYLHSMKLQLTNLASKTRDVDIDIPWGPGIGADAANRKNDNALTSASGLVQTAKSLKAVTIKQGENDASSYKWIGMGNRYFLMAMVNTGNLKNVKVENKKYSAEKLTNMVMTSKIVLKPGENINLEFPFYLGPKDYDNLKKIGYGLENSIDFGFFKPLAKVAFDMLRFFYRITGNYGIAIILLTLVVQFILMPLTMKSYKASKAMKDLQPKMKELQLKYKSDPARLNTETMHLYKSHKVNPLGGCLPMILQIPIFFALFQTLQNAYELRHAPFMFWIKDLSSPDLLFSLGGVPVRILPLLMGIGMYLQQKYSGVSADPSQKSLTYIMPVMFTVIFWNFASGLVIYWLLSSIFSMTVQYLMSSNNKISTT